MKSGRWLSASLALIAVGCSGLPNDPITPPPLMELDAGDKPIFAVAWSPDGKWIAVGTDEGEVSLFPAEGTPEEGFLKRKHTLPMTLDRITDLAFSPDGGALLAAGQDGRWRLWELTDRAFPSQEGRAEKPLLACGFGQDGSPLLARPGVWAYGKLQGVSAAVEPHQIVIGGETLPPPNGDRFTSGAIGKRLVAAGTEGGRLVVAPVGGSPLTVPCLPHRISAVALSPDETKVALGGVDAWLQIRDARSGALLLKIPFQTGWITDIAWSPDGSRLVVSGHDLTHSPGVHRVRVYGVD